MKRRSLLILAALLPLPLLMAALWALSGRETFSKSQKNVEVEVRDDVFGDTTRQVQAVPGPVAGYYVGLDAVGLAAGVGIVAAGAAAWLTRSGRARPAQEATT